MDALTPGPAALREGEVYAALAFGCRGRARPPPAPAALREGEVYAALAQLRQADHDGPIDLPGGLVSKRSGEERGSGGIACDQQHARGVLVEPVHEARALGA